MFRRDRLAMCAALLLASYGPVAGQEYSFRHYAAADGLQNLSILSLAQDRAGYIWAGSEGGLYRYDGTRFRLMAAAEGLPCSSEVHALFVAADGALWANTCSKVFRFDGQKFHAIPGLNGMFSSTQSMANGVQGHVLVSTPAGLYDAAPHGADEFVASPFPLGPGFSGMPTRGIARRGPELWFGCERRLCREEGGRITVFGPAEGLPEDAWDAIGFTPDGSVWARSPSKLFRKAGGSERLVQENPALASSIFWGALTATRDGSLMIPTDKGVAVRRDGRWSVIDEKSGLRTPMISSVLEDREGSLWIALIGSGVARWLGFGEWEGWTNRQGLPSDLIWSIHRDRKGALWVGTSLGVARMNGSEPERVWTRKEGLGGDNARWLGETSDGAMWVVVKPGGVVRIDPVSGKVRLVGAADGLPCMTSHRGFVDEWTGCGLPRPAVFSGTTSRVDRWLSIAWTSPPRWSTGHGRLRRTSRGRCGSTLRMGYGG